MSESYDDYLDALKGLIKHVVIYADQVHKDATKTTISLRSFAKTLMGDRALFKLDHGLLMNMTTISAEALKEKMSELANHQTSAGAYERAIKVAMKKIEDFHQEVCLCFCSDER